MKNSNLAKILFILFFITINVCRSDDAKDSDVNGLHDQTHTAYLFQKVILYNAIFQYKKEIGRFPHQDSKKVLPELMKDNILHKQFVEQPSMLKLNAEGQAIGENGKPVTFKFVGDEICVLSDGTAIVGPASNSANYRIVEVAP
jgi:hypothetical protein